MMSGGLEDDGCCEIKASCVAGQGLFATKDLVKGQVLFKETAFLVPGRRDDAAVIATSSKLPPLSPITVQHKHCPPCVRLAPTDTGGVLSGCYEETYSFALAYLSSTASIRSRVQELSSNMRPTDTTTTAPATTTDNDGHDDDVDDDGDDNSNAIVTLVRREVAWLRKCDRDLRSLPSRELEGAVHRQATTGIHTTIIIIATAVPRCTYLNVPPRTCICTSVTSTDIACQCDIPSIYDIVVGTHHS